MDAIKIRVDKRAPNLTKLLFYESKDGGASWVFNGQLNCDPEIAALFLDVMYRGRGRWNLIVEDYLEV
jgi:hypothetical protein